MELVDTLPANAKQVADQLNTVATAMAVMLHPAFIAIFTNTLLLWALDAFDRFLPAALLKPGTKEIDHRIRFILAAVLTIPTMAVAMFLMEQKFRGANAGYAILSGPVALFLLTVLKRVGFDLDKLWSADDEAKPNV